MQAVLSVAVVLVLMTSCTLVWRWGLLYSLILLYQFTPLEIECIGLVVIGLYAVIAILFFRRRVLLAEILSTADR